MTTDWSQSSPSVEVGQSTSVEALLERLATAEPAAVGEVYDLHHGALRTFAKRLVGDDSSAEDLVQEVFLHLPRAIQRFEGRSSLRTFLISIALNHARHHVRAAVRRRNHAQRLAREPALTPLEDPEQRLTRAELAQALTRALDVLSLDHRVAFVLCEVEEKTSLEAAEIIGVPEGTVRSRLFHAKKKLRLELAKELFA